MRGGEEESERERERRNRMKIFSQQHFFVLTYISGSRFLTLISIPPDYHNHRQQRHLSLPGTFSIQNNSCCITDDVRMPLLLTAPPHGS